jgi:uncharacterized membrane protein YGL010W
MKTLNEWLDLYSVSHQNPTNKLVHKICVPVITFTVFGFFWCIPVPEVMNFHPLSNFATLFGILTLVFYARLSILLLILMSIKVAVMLYLCHLVEASFNLLQVSIILFVLAWIGQFWGHKVEGKKPSFFQDLQFLLIGPIWVVKAITGLPKNK